MSSNREKQQKIKRSRVNIAVSNILLGSVLTATALNAYAFAEEKNAEEETEVIEVTGSYAKSMEKAIDIKRMTVGFSDSLVAADVADFPEQNLVEALQRMPGISMERERGLGKGISVRSLPSKYTNVLFNGLSAAGGANRSVDLDMFSTDVIQQVTITKSPVASEMAGGVAGTIKVRTARPFDYESDRLIVSADAAHNSVSGEIDPKLGILASKQMGDWGVLASYSASERTARTDNNFGSTLRESGRWFGGANDLLFKDALARYGYDVGDSTDFRQTDLFAIAKNAGQEIFEDDQDKWGATIGLQYQPSDTLSVSLEGMFAEYTNESTKVQNVNYISDSPNYPEMIHSIDTTSLEQWGIAVITDADYALAQMELKAQESVSESDYQQFILSVDWDVAGWNIHGLAGLSTRDTDQVTTDLEYETHQRVRAGFNSEGAYTAMAAPSAADPTPWDPYAASSAEDYLFRKYNIQHRQTESETKSLQLDFEKQFELVSFPALSKVQFGLHSDVTQVGGEFADRRFNGPTEGDSSWLGNRTLAEGDWGFASEVSNGDSFEFGEDFIVLNINDMDSRYAFDGYTLNDDPWSTWQTDETATALYAMADFAFEIADMQTYLNVGGRYMSNTVTAYGFETSLSTGTGVSNEAIKSKGKSNDFLPSITVSLEITDDLVLRAAASQTLLRPSLQDMNNIRNINFNNLKITAGNPDLESEYADQWEMGLEYYLPEGGLLAFSYYHKTIENARENQMTGTETLTFTDSSGVVTTDEFEVWQQVNIEGEYEIDGMEFNIQLPLGPYIEMLEGFGLDANYTVLNTNVATEDEILPFIPTSPRGFIDDVYNATVYYENETFDVRLSFNHKSEYYDNISYNLYPIYREAYDQLDLSTGFYVNENIKVSVKVINLTDEVPNGYNMSPSFLTKNETTGRRISLGVRASF